MDNQEKRTAAHSTDTPPAGSPGEETLAELSRLVREFKATIQKGLEDPDQMMSFTEIEQLWSELIENSNSACAGLLDALRSQQAQKTDQPSAKPAAKDAAAEGPAAKDTES